MANPTTNYSFILPTPTDLVTDLPADFEVALQGVDTQLKALQPGTTVGDLAYSSATANTNVRLGIGTSGQVLAVSGGGVPAWTTTSDVTPLTTKGDLFTFSTVDARLAVGTNGQVLTADSSEATGLKFATPASGGGMTLLSTTTITGVSTSVTSISGAHKNLVISIENVVLSGTDTQINATLNSSASQVSSYLQNKISWDNQFNDDYRLTANASMDVSSPNQMANVMTISNYTSTTAKPFTTHGNFTKTDTSQSASYQVGSVLTTSAITSFQIFTSNATSTMTGTIKIYGVS